ncbi:hypothetical protein FLP41_15855 [Paracoccus marcusii]|uniref:hypothetical protein n=1 Tax=Paracoccus marcusii TaxID=59779 RepID=UPI002ED4E385|nr:hypothetical protein FLP41_15855 [Paracoccus marcusii]
MSADQGANIDGREKRSQAHPDTIFVEMLWRALTYERVHLHARETGSETKAAIRQWMTFAITSALTQPSAASHRRYSLAAK